MTSIKSFGQQIQSFWKSQTEPKSQPEITKQTTKQAPTTATDQLKTQNLASGKSPEKIHRSKSTKRRFIHQRR